MSIILVILFLAGFIQETLYVSYHRALAANKIVIVASLTTIIWLIGIFVMTEIIKLISASHSWGTLALIASFACGKFVGALLSIKYWSKHKSV